MLDTLTSVLKVRTGDPYGRKLQRRSPRHTPTQAAWLARRAGIAFATEDEYLFEALSIFARFGPDIRFDVLSGFVGNRDGPQEREWSKFLTANLGDSRAEVPTRPLKAVLPRFEDLSWDEVIHLRTHRMHDEFRNWFGRQRGQGLSIASGSAALPEKVTEGLWKLARAVQPNVGETVVEAFLGNIPLPLPVSPIGLILSAKDVAEERKRQQDYG